MDLSAWKLKNGGLVGKPASLSLDEIKALPSRTEAVTMECAGKGRALEPQHGEPLRLVRARLVRDDQGEMAGQHRGDRRTLQRLPDACAYRYVQTADDPGEPVDLIWVRALMVPPGIPNFMTRTRLLNPGPVTLSGRAWAGREGISRVEISTDGGANWSDAHGIASFQPVPPPFVKGGQRGISPRGRSDSPTENNLMVYSADEESKTG